MITFIRQIDSTTIAINGAEFTVPPGQIDRWMDALEYDYDLAERMEQIAINSMIRESARINHHH